MNKRLKVLLTAIIVCTFILPTSYASAKPNNVKNIITNKVEVKEKESTKKEDSKGKDKQENKKNEKLNKHLFKMTDVILKRISSIEKETLKIEDQIKSYFEVGISTTDNSEEDSIDENTTETNVLEESAETSEENIVTEEVSEETEEAQDEEVEAEENQDLDEAVEDTEESNEEVVIEDEEELEDETQESDEEISEEEQEELEEELEDAEEEFENEDNGKYNSFYGKLNAQLNKLNSVVNKLDSLSKRYGEENEELIDAYAQVEGMKEKINLLISDLDAKQSSVVKSIRENKNKKVIEPKKDVAENKSWQITFSKELDSETVNGENIVVSDAEGNIVAVDISYNLENKQVLIKSSEGFESGKTYYLNISTNVKSAEGNSLSEAIEMGFTIN